MEDVNQKGKYYCSYKEGNVAREKKSVKGRFKSKRTERYKFMATSTRFCYTSLGFCFYGIAFTAYAESDHTLHTIM